MNKRGFTLVELLAVIIILSIILALVFPTISSILNRSKETIYDTQVNKILNATYDYTLNDVNLLPNEGEVKYITLAHLIKDRLIDYNFKNPKTNELYEDNLIISIRNVKDNYNIEKTTESMQKGNYLYKIEFELIDSDDFKENAPVISFEGHDITPIVLNINIGDVYTPLNYTATSNDGETLTNSVIENIIYDSRVVEKIDTSVAGIYYINYSVIDDYGYSSSETVNLIVTDIEKPNLIIPESVTIGSDVNSYDLMDGVSCTDNSGKCNVDINGNVKFNIVGKYIIEYRASDPSGNTTILKRVITVK